MEIRQLQYFVEVARSHSFSAAADKLYISHQALSKAITCLESELGLKLFERTYAGIDLTMDGIALLENAMVVLNAEKELQEKAQELRDSVRDICSVGFMQSSFRNSQYAISVEDVMRFKKYYPQAAVRISEGTSDQIKRLVKVGLLDLGVVCGGGDSKGELRAEQVATLSFGHAVVSCSNPLSSCGLLTMASLDGQTIVVPPEDEYGNMLMRNAAANAGATLHFLEGTTSLEANLGLVYAGEGVTLVADNVCGFISADSARVIPLEKPFKLPVCIIWSSSRSLRPAAISLRDYLRSIIK